MEHINFEKEICQYLGIPSIPKKKWDCKSSFQDACAVVQHLDKSLSYAVATFNAEKDKVPRVKKVFTLELFNEVKEIYIVPPYMNTDIANMDLDDESKENAEALVEEAKEMEAAGSEDDFNSDENEYVFDNIHNDEEAKAYIKAYNRKKKNKGSVPRTHEGIIMRLNVIKKELDNGK